MNPDAILEAAEETARILKQHGVESVVIGAIALAAYHYVRQTEDIDLGVNTDLSTLKKVVQSLSAFGYQAELREPDGSDPLGGVIDINGSFGLVQIINFGDRFPAVINNALREATLTVREGSPLRLAPIEQLIALKLYAGGHKSKADIIELLICNPDLDLEMVQRVCTGYHLPGFDELIAELKH